MGAPREGILSEEPLYDPKILERLDFSKARTKFSTPVSAARPGEGLRVRPLRRADYRRGFLQLLSQLTSVGDVSEEQFLKRFDAMQACPNTYYVTVIEDTTNGQVIGASTLVIEQKFIHGCNVRGRLEDVVVNNTYRGKQLGKLIITTVTLLAEELKCYKMTLDCKDKLVPFYSSLGYSIEKGNSNYMQIRFDEAPS
ncbi:probable glucosamine 6-phosphate N-acetyltransferase isoform X1 [Frankliniella occidentalis]|uniref:Glucosamine 6-phosphate N-acetyltransferase n=1 Tax=Frankliniella occidentalis TaxID=133901 RepID=A0A9C6X2H6_FRAOC|nr:probable glucosamine 6-phosphate N-acetyltransferase isoform X1 [Frankliniella occidentalis]